MSPNAEALDSGGARSPPTFAMPPMWECRTRACEAGLSEGRGAATWRERHRARGYTHLQRGCRGHHPGFPDLPDHGRHHGAVRRGYLAHAMIAVILLVGALIFIAGVVVPVR